MAKKKQAKVQKAAGRPDLEATLRHTRPLRRDLTALDTRVTELAARITMLEGGARTIERTLAAIAGEKTDERITNLTKQLADMAAANVELTRRLDALEPEGA